MRYRKATIDDLSLLTKLNKQLVVDERHRHRFWSMSKFEERMREFLAGKYQGIIFEDDGKTVAYALFCDNGDHIYLRQFFVSRDCRRKGIGREAVEVLKKHIWPKDKRITVGVLSHNKAGYAFWKAVGFKDHAIELEMVAEDKGLC